MGSRAARVLSLVGWLILSACATRSDWVKLDELPTLPRIDALQLVSGDVVEFEDASGRCDVNRSLVEGLLASGKKAAYPIDSVIMFRLKTSDGLSTVGTVALIVLGFAVSILVVGIMWLSERGGA